MVSGTLVDALVNPSLAINDLFALERSEDFPSIVRDHFSALFAGDNIHQIPLLDVANPPDAHLPKSLVRFRAMIQDTSCSPEMYLSTLKDSKCGGWGLDATEELSEDTYLHSDYNSLRERDVIWAVSIPGESYWCEQSRNSLGSIPSSHGRNASHHKAHKFPFPEEAHVAVQIKIYDNSAESLKPTGLHEFVGILTSEAVHSDFAVDVTAPTLHVLFHRRIPKTIIQTPSSEPEVSTTLSIRDELISWMASEGLGGDRDAAEWVLLSTLSSVESRNPPLFPMPITLSGFAKSSSESIPSISLILSEVVPLHFLLPLTLKLLNEQSFRPESKDEDLHSGILQVPHDTIIVLTETGMTEGNLGEKGIENVQALQEVAKLQTLQYKFPFSQYSFPTDIKFITLTDGKRSLFLDSGVNVPLRPDASANLYRGKDWVNWPSPEKLSAFRDLIIRAKVFKVTVGGELSEHIKNEFVRERQEKPSVTPDDLARRMTIARLIALSRLEGQMTLDSWNAARALDNHRKSRIL